MLGDFFKTTQSLKNGKEPCIYIYNPLDILKDTAPGGTFVHRHSGLIASIR